MFLKDLILPPGEGFSKCPLVPSCGQFRKHCSGPLTSFCHLVASGVCRVRPVSVYSALSRCQPVTRSTSEVHFIMIVSKDVLVVSSLHIKEEPSVLSRKGFNVKN